MKVTAIISEYNPLHNGHIYHINKTKEITGADNLICVMSGNFVQRGLPSIVDKWKRTEIALHSGVDLVLELPAVYSISSAEFFSFGSISLLNSLGIVDNLSFGSENDNVDLIMKVAKVLIDEPYEFKKILKHYISKGFSYPKARNNALCSFLLNTPDLNELLNSSNSILAIEYCKSILQLKSNIKPYAIKRIGSLYNDENLTKNFSSATAIRKALELGTNIDLLKENFSSFTFQYLSEIYKNGYPHISEELMFPFLKYKLYTEKNSLNLLSDVSEGLDKKIFKELKNSDSLNNFILNIKSKRYTYTRINRILCHYFIGLEIYDIKSLRSAPCPYCRVLGFNTKGIDLLGEIKKKSKIPIIVKLSDDISEAMEVDLQCTKAYSILNNNIRYNEDYFRSPIKI